MSLIILHWSLAHETREATFEKYCPNCGKKVLFVDSKLRRRNANGKDIYEYAIYKCPKEHTWNKSIRRYKAYDESISQLNEVVEKTDRSFQPLVISEFIRAGVEKIEIYLDFVEGRWRIDRLLAERVKDLSRTRIQEFIAAGLITINGKPIKPDELLKQNQTITLPIHCFHEVFR